MDKNYGTDTCQQPDMDFESAKRVFLKKLQLNCENRERIERSTLEQSESDDWYY